MILILVAAGLLAHGVEEFEEAGVLPELVPLWDLSNAPMLGAGSFVSGLLTAFLGWNPEAHLLEFVAWAVYILSVGYAFLRPQPPAGGVARPAEAREG